MDKILFPIFFIRFVPFYTKTHQVILAYYTYPVKLEKHNWSKKQRERFCISAAQADYGQAAGLDAAERLEQLSPRTRVVFVTGYNDRFSQEIFLRSSNLSGYLVKPIDGKLLTANLDKAQKSVQQEEDLSLVLRSRGDILTIPFRNILYLESKGHHVHTFTSAAFSTGISVGKLTDHLIVWFVSWHTCKRLLPV